jgi:DNA polymerase-1
VRKYGYVRSPLGRIRRLPDIESQDWSVAAEAERQAINSPVQATASDMILLALSMLMGELEHEVTKEFEAFSGDGVVTIATVHDSLVFLIREDMLDHWIPRIKHTMEHLPLERLFGWSPTVPITVEIQKYKYWGEEE